MRCLLTTIDDCLTLIAAAAAFLLYVAAAAVAASAGVGHSLGRMACEYMNERVSIPTMVNPNKQYLLHNKDICKCKNNNGADVSRADIIRKPWSQLKPLTCVNEDEFVSVQHQIGQCHLLLGWMRNLWGLLVCPCAVCHSIPQQNQQKHSSPCNSAPPCLSQHTQHVCLAATAPAMLPVLHGTPHQPLSVTRAAAGICWLQVDADMTSPRKLDPSYTNMRTGKSNLITEVELMHYSKTAGAFKVANADFYCKVARGWQKLAELPPTGTELEVRSYCREPAPAP